MLDHSKIDVQLRRCLIVLQNPVSELLLSRADTHPAEVAH